MEEMGQCLGLVAKAVGPAATAEDEAVDGSALLNLVMMADVTADSPGDPTCVHPDITMRPAEVALIEQFRSELVKSTITTQIKLERVVDELALWIPKDKANYFKVCVSIFYPLFCYYSKFLLFLRYLYYHPMHLHNGLLLQLGQFE
jgi:hypothetical protein